MNTDEGPILDCSCGQDHETMPMVDIGDGYEAPGVCRIHKRHEPCRKCLYSDPEFLAFREAFKAEMAAGRDRDD